MADFSRDKDALLKLLTKFGSAEYKKSHGPYPEAIIKNSTEIDISTLYKLAKNNKGTNIAGNTSQYIPLDAAYRQFPYNLSTAGMVFDTAPNTVFMGRSDLAEKTATDLIAHESAHVQQNREGSRVPSGSSDTPIDILDKLRKLAKKDEVSFRAANATSNIRELLANLQAMEGLMPERKTIWDNPEIAAAIPEPFVRRYIDQKMFPTMDKVYPGPEPTMLDKILGVFK